MRPIGKLILCSGKRTTRPYILTGMGRVYSIEELCYYISHHIYYVNDDFFSEALIDWLDFELGLTDRAEKIRKLKLQQADLKTLLAALLCSADYFTEREIKILIKQVDEISRMSPIKRMSLRGDRYLIDCKYHDAIREYERIINTKDSEGITPEEYGDILHNLAVAKARSKGSKGAVDLFRQAYERNQREESLRQYLYSLKLSNANVEYEKQLGNYQIGDDLRGDILMKLDEIEKNSATCDEMLNFEKIKQLREEGRLDEYKQQVEDMINQWIVEIRQL